MSEDEELNEFARVDRGQLVTEQVLAGTMQPVPPYEEDTVAAEPDDDEELAGEPFPLLNIPDDVLRPIADYQGTYTWAETDCQWIATLPDYRGVIAVGDTHVACRDDLVETFRECISFRVWRHLDVPEIPGVDVRAYAFQ